MFIINVFDSKTNCKIGNSKMDKDAYDWNRNVVHSFGFIPNDSKYVYGIFLMENAEDVQSSEEEFNYKVSKYKLLLRNTNPASQFDDDANSQWIEF